MTTLITAITIYLVIALIVGLTVKYIDTKNELYFLDGDNAMIGFVGLFWPVSLFFIIIIAICTFVGKGLSWIYDFLEDKFTK